MDNPVLIIGDVHGELESLTQLVKLAREKHGQDIQIFSLGDLIDRGPNPAGVIEFCIQENILTIMGNHEYWLAYCLMHGEFWEDALISMRAPSTIKSYLGHIPKVQNIASELKKSVPIEHQNFILNLPFFRVLEIQGQSYYLIHGCLLKTTGDKIKESFENINDADLLYKICEINPDILMWSRPTVYSDGTMDVDNLFKFNNGIQIIGHTIIPKGPFVSNEVIALDTGSGKGGKLTGIILPTKEIIQVETKKENNAI